MLIYPSHPQPPPHGSLLLLLGYISQCPWQISRAGWLILEKQPEIRCVPSGLAPGAPQWDPLHALPFQVALPGLGLKGLCLNGRSLLPGFPSGDVLAN